MAQKDVFQILEDIRKRALGITDSNSRPIEGFMISFLPTGRPVLKEDYSNPWTPNTVIPNLPDGTPDPNVAEKVAKRMQSLVNLSMMVDHKLQLNVSGQQVPGASKISESWQVIINGASAKPLPPIDDPNLKKALSNANKLLFKPDPDADPSDPDQKDAVVNSRVYDKYDELRKKYNKAVQNFANGYATVMATNPGVWPVLGRSYQSDVDAAWDEWTSLGKKVEVENAIDLLAAQGGDAPVKMIALAKKVFDKYMVTGGVIPVAIPYVQLFPTNWCDPDKDNDGWTGYTYDSLKTTNSSSSSTTSYGGSTGINFGFWSFGAGASHSNSNQRSEFSEEKLKISFKYALVDIERPYINTILLNMSNWFLNGFKKNTISTGKIDQQRPLNNEAFWLPSIPTQLFVIKELCIQTKDTKAMYEAAQSETKLGGSFGYGPFTIGGNYSKSENNSKSSFELTAEGLKVKGVQIMGWVSQVLPPSPQIDAPNIPS